MLLKKLFILYPKNIHFNHILNKVHQKNTKKEFLKDYFLIFNLLIIFNNILFNI